MIYTTLKKKDYKKAIDFAVKGMQFDKYMSAHFIQKLYGKYFLYMEMARASRIIAAYDEDDCLQGLIMINIEKEEKIKITGLQKGYVALFIRLMKLVVKDSTDVYDDVNKKMLKQFKERSQVDGEICFLAANPAVKRKGIGTGLIEALSQVVKGKKIYLYTDSNCNYHFYEKRQFVREEEEDIVMALETDVPLTCYLYSRQF